jgi:hypothetical protein
MVVANRWGFPDLGLGLGLRSPHYDFIRTNWPRVDWFEILSENYLATAGRPLWVLDEIAERYPMVMHGVSLSIGSADPIDFEYLRRLKDLAARVRAVWLGDHVCWTGIHGRNTHELLPMPYNDESLRHVVKRVRVVQDFLERPLVMENPSTYMTFAQSTMSEAEFLTRLAQEGDCALLLDVNNVYVTCRNHDFDAKDYLAQLPYDRVVQIHLAGHLDKGTHCIDTHGDTVIDEVWKLYAEVQRRAGSRATMVEWDTDIPAFQVVHEEVQKAARYRAVTKVS